MVSVGAGDTATASRWWLLDFSDHEPLTVAFSPAAILFGGSIFACCASANPLGNLWLILQRHRPVGNAPPGFRGGSTWMRRADRRRAAPDFMLCHARAIRAKKIC